ncbi:exportin-6-A [Vanessa cardui]|uniref:exportin-6-A n=1 Tax=Vanessa cardui TaxID=171605 RepID=UPI001F13B0E9|nr:exportin-6-A [Vanessa cardui]
MGDFEINEALASLEMLMSEFFAPTTNNFRKREIENMLENFSNARDSWKHCLLFLQKSQNQYVLMFILTTLEKIINRQWIRLSDDEKTEVRLTLMNELMNKHDVMYFIRNKLAALLVSIARYDWPHLYPDFFTNIVELLKCEGRQCIIGLVLAQAASEELGAARDTGVLLPSARKSQLERLMLKGMPQMLAALSAILEKNAQKEGQSNPPPSPTSGLPQTSALPDLLANAHDVHSTEKALNMEIVVKCLTTLQHLFSWLPLSSHVPPSLVTTVFYWGSIATQSQSTEAALAGLGGVCELLYRRYAPPSSAATALRLQHCALRLLRHLHHAHHMMRAHPDYLNKLAEFLKLFVSLHFKRLEAEPEFDAIEFLSYLFQYTFQVPTCATFVSCLDIWIQFIDVLKPEDTPKYWEALQALVISILNKIQFQHNKAQLQHLDNDVCDDDGETEWQTFLKHCIECIARVADLAPLEVFTAVMERWQCLADVHARAAGRGGAGGEAERLLAALLDLATLTRLLGRLAPALLAEPENGAAGGGAGGATRAQTAGAALVERCASALAGAALTRPHRAHPSPALARAHVILHAEMFACMGAWCCYAGEVRAAPPTMQGLLASALPFLVPHDAPEPPLLCHAAAHLLLSLSKNVKFANDPMVMLSDLYNHAQRSLHYLEPKTAGVVREALVSLALARGAAGSATGGTVGGQEAARALLASWSAALPVAGPAAALPPLTALLHAFAAAPTAAKKIIAEGVSSAAESALRMLCEPAYASAETDITDFFLALFTALLPQLGAFAYTAIDVFLEVAQRDSGDSSGSLERLVECVRLGVEAGGGGVRVRAVLQLLHTHVLPRADPAPALARAAHRLLASVLIHRWRYFFPHSCSGEEGARRSGELRGALAAVGRALLAHDIELLRGALATIDTLNAKWKLYHKAIFRSEFMCEFLSVLLSGLAEGGARALLRDEALGAVHAMAAVDFAVFRHGFLPHFLQSLPGLDPQRLGEFPPDTDLPTFTQNILRLMNDVNCYRAYQSLTCNEMGL